MPVLYRPFLPPKGPFLTRLLPHPHPLEGAACSKKQLLNCFVCDSEKTVVGGAVLPGVAMGWPGVLGVPVLFNDFDSSANQNVTKCAG